MSLKAYLWGLRISTVLALLAWSLTVVYVDPEKGGYVGQVLFYPSLFLVVTGFSTLIFTAIRRRKVEAEGQLFHIGMSLRQGLLLGILTVGLLLMQSFRVLVWWDGLLALAAVLLAELYFLSR